MTYWGEEVEAYRSKQSAAAADRLDAALTNQTLLLCERRILCRGTWARNERHDSMDTPNRGAAAHGYWEPAPNASHESRISFGNGWASRCTLER
jgi:hypothetical protein